MGKYNHPSPKRTKVWSASWAIALLDQGQLKKKEKKKVKKPTTKKYVDSTGKERFHGTKALKDSQTLGCYWSARQRKH